MTVNMDNGKLCGYLAAKPNVLSSIPWIYMVEGEN